MLTLDPIRLNREELLAALYVQNWPRLKLSNEEDGTRLYFTDKDCVGIDEYRKRLLVAIQETLRNLGPRARVLIDPPPGTGKTRMVAQVLMDLDMRQLWFMPTHKLIAEHLRSRDEWKLGKPATDCFHLKGRDRMIDDRELECNFRSDMRPPGKAKPPGEERASLLCEYACNNKARCPYYANLKKAVRKQVVFLVHQHLKAYGVIKRLLPRKDIIVIDEDAVLLGTREFVIPKNDIADYLHMLQQLTANVRQLSYINTRDELIATGSELINIGKRGGMPKLLTPSSMTLGDLRWLEGLIHHYYAGQIKKVGHPSHLPKNLTNTFWRLRQARLNIPVWGRYGQPCYLERVPLPGDKPVIILDAEANIATYSRSLDTTVKNCTVKANFKLIQTAKIFQFVDAPYLKSEFLTRKRTVAGEEKEEQIKNKPTDEMFPLIEKICRLHDDQKVGIITFKKVDEAFIQRIKAMTRRKRERNRLPLKWIEITDNPPSAEMQSAVAIGHYGGLRGSNFFEHFDVLVLVGVQRMSGETMQEYYRVFCHGYDGEDKYVRFQRKESWPRRQTQENGLTTYRHYDSCLDDLFEAAVLRELYQSIGRIRPFRELPDKHPPIHPIVYLVTSVKLKDEWYEVSGFLQRDEFMAAVDKHLTTFRASKVDKQKTLLALKKAIGRMDDKNNHYLYTDLYDRLPANLKKGRKEFVMSNLRNRYFEEKYQQYLGVILPKRKYHFKKVSLTEFLQELAEKNIKE